MERKSLRGGRVQAAAYDASDRRLEIDLIDGERRIYRNVPVEVWRRLIAAPNAATYLEDRIEDEYPVERARGGASPQARSKLDALFGASPAGSDSEK
jgi:YD repeat-containing protein